MKKEYSFISHQFDVWHFSKSIKIKLCKHANSSSKKSLNNWIKSIINHLWWWCWSCDGDSEVLKEKWWSILYHIGGIHSWEGGKHFPKCEHVPLQKERNGWKQVALHSELYSLLRTIKRCYRIWSILENFDTLGI